MAYPSYNGWSGMIREARNTVFFAAIKSGELDDHQKQCIGCGITRGQAAISLHSEEYGPLPADYISTCVPVCFRCHYMIHVRHKIPKRWLRYLNRVADGDLPKPLVGGWIAANQLLQDGDLEDGVAWQWVATPTGYLSGLPLEEYSGPRKVALVEVNGLAIPDPRLYLPDPSNTGAVVERKYKEGVANSKIPLDVFLKQQGAQASLF